MYLKKKKKLTLSLGGQSKLPKSMGTVNSLLKKGQNLS